jgi:hypothetical protein
MPAPDLLSHLPAIRLDAAQLKQTLTFAFASGVPSTAFAQILEGAALPHHLGPQSLRRSSFSSSWRDV